MADTQKTRALIKSVFEDIRKADDKAMTLGQLTAAMLVVADCKRGVPLPIAMLAHYCHIVNAALSGGLTYEEFEATFKAVWDMMAPHTDEINKKVDKALEAHEHARAASNN